MNTKNNPIINIPQRLLIACLIPAILLAGSTGFAGEVTSAGGIQWGKMMMGLFNIIKQGKYFI